MTSQQASGWRTLSKRNAFLIHVTLSLLVFMTLVMVMVTMWFPGELFFLDGGWEGLKLVALVDLVLGPALTLLLFKPGKKNLAMDMSLIAGIQIAALAYGFVTTYEQRTAAVVFAEGKFNTLSQPAYEDASQTLIEHELQPQSIASLDDRKPATLLYPESAGSFAENMQEMLNGLPQMFERSDRLVIAKNNSDEIRDNAVTDEQLKLEDTQGTVTKALAKQKQTADIDVYRFTARYGSGFALFDHSDGRIVDYIKIEKESQKRKTDVAESTE